MTSPLAFLRRRPQLVAYVLLAGGIAFSQWSIYNVVLHDQAEDCVDDWERVEDIRRGVVIPTEALIMSFPGADPADVEAVRRNSAALLEDTFPDPDCDLDAARRRLGD